MVDTVVGERQRPEVADEVRHPGVVSVVAGIGDHLGGAIQAVGAAGVVGVPERPGGVAAAAAQAEYGVAGLDRHPRQGVLCGVPVSVLHAPVAALGGPGVELLANAHGRPSAPAELTATPRGRPVAGP